MRVYLTNFLKVIGGGDDRSTADNSFMVSGYPNSSNYSPVPSRAASVPDEVGANWKNRSWKYRKACETDITRTFEKARKELKNEVPKL